MKKVRYSFIFYVLVVCSSCVKDEQTIGTLDGASGAPRCEAYVPGEMVIQFDAATALIMDRCLKSGAGLKSGYSELDAVFENLAVNSVERVFPDAGEWEDRHREFGLHRFYHIRYDENKAVETKVGNILSSVGGVVSAEPVHRIKRLSDPYFNDPYFSYQWHYNNTTSGISYKAGADINVLPVWKEFTTGSPEVIISVVDGGVNLEHEDLSAITLKGGPDGSRNFYDNNYVIGADDHGTHVAGTIAAINNNGKGVCGIAGGEDGNGGVRIMSCQIFPSSGKGSGNSAQAIVWGADHGAVISQNSWGYDYENQSQALSGNIDSATKAAIDYFVANAGIDRNGNQTGLMKGGVVFFAAGNDGWPIGWPGAYEGCIAVGAVSSLGTRSYYSNYGDWVDIAAPGGDVKIGPQVWSTIADGYGSMQGTSMACPHISGVAALLVSYFGGQGFTNEMLLEKLFGGANYDFLPSGAQIGPLVDAYGAFLYGDSLAPEKVESYSVEPVGGGAKLSWKVGADENGKVAYAYKILAASDESVFEGINLNKVPFGVTESVIYVPEGARRGDEISGIVSGLSFDSDYYVTVAAFDYGKSFSEIADIKSVHTKENGRPEIRELTALPWEVSATQTFTARVSVTDPDGHQLNVKFVPDSRLATAASVQTADGNYEISVNALKEDSGTYKLSYSVSDIYGASASRTFNLTILANRSPEVLQEMDNMVFSIIGESRTFDAGEYFSDEDGDVLTYTVSHSNPRVIHVSPVGNQLTFTALGYGVDNIVIRASDAKNEYAEISFSVAVRDSASGVDVYPSQVTDMLYVSGGEEAETHIEISTSLGVVVFEKTMSTSVFAPAKIDMSKVAPGIYTVKVVIGGVESVRTIVKL